MHISQHRPCDRDGNLWDPQITMQAGITRANQMQLLELPNDRSIRRTASRAPTPIHAPRTGVDTRALGMNPRPHLVPPNLPIRRQYRPMHLLLK
jgi:hypothetical protein